MKRRPRRPIQVRGSHLRARKKRRRWGTELLFLPSSFVVKDKPKGRKAHVFESEFERNLFELRKEKLAEIEKLGQAAYPNQFPFSHTIPDIRAGWNETQAEDLEAKRVTVAVAGRIMAIRQ